MESRNFTILLNDIVGFTETTSNMKRESMMKMLQTHDDLIRPLLATYHGRIVKTMGDAFLSVFDSPTNAVLCAVKIQEVLQVHNQPLPSMEQIHVRCALHAGEVQVADNGDIFGEAVNITARLEAVTPRGAVYITENVNLQVNRNEIPETKAEKKYRFKGITHEVQVYQVCLDDDTAPSEKRSVAQLMIPIVATLIIAGMATFAALTLRNHTPRNTVPPTDTPTAETTTNTNIHLRETEPTEPDDEYKPQTYYINNDIQPNVTETDTNPIDNSIIESVGTPGAGIITDNEPPKKDDFKSVLESTVTP